MAYQYYIFGLQRSGTNFLEEMLARNFKARKMNNGSTTWKHIIDVPTTNDFKADVPQIRIFKNPYTWCESIIFRNTVDYIKKQRAYPVDIKPENNSHSGTIARGSHGTEFYLPNLALTYVHWQHTWNQKHPNAMIIRYEDLLDEKKRNIILMQIGTKFKWNPISPEFVGRAYGAVSQSSTYDEKSEKYYRAQMPKQLSQHQLNTITSVLKPVNINKWGYNIVNLPVNA